MGDTSDLSTLDVKTHPTNVAPTSKSDLENTTRRDDEFAAVLENVPVAFGLSQLKSMRDAAMRTKEQTDLGKFEAFVGRGKVDATRRPGVTKCFSGPTRHWESSVGWGTDVDCIRSDDGRAHFARKETMHCFYRGLPSPSLA